MNISSLEYFKLSNIVRVRVFKNENRLFEQNCVNKK